MSNRSHDPSKVSCDDRRWQSQNLCQTSIGASINQLGVHFIGLISLQICYTMRNGRWKSLGNVFPSRVVYCTRAGWHFPPLFTKQVQGIETCNCSPRSCEIHHLGLRTTQWRLQQWMQLVGCMNIARWHTMLTRVRMAAHTHEEFSDTFSGPSAHLAGFPESLLWNKVNRPNEFRICLLLVYFKNSAWLPLKKYNLSNKWWKIEFYST